MNEDMTLVREYAQNNSEQAFATLVSRHINLVYSTALRMVGDSHQAQDVAQSVFVALAQNARFAVTAQQRQGCCGRMSPIR